MPYNKVPIRFYDDAGKVISFVHDRIEEPPSGEQNGTTFTLTYTPLTAGQVVSSGQVSGPTARARADISVDGGSTWHTSVALPGSPGVGQPYTIKIRGVGLPFSGDDSDTSGFVVAITDPGGEAGWLA